VGIALSGGGATSAALVPFLGALAAEGIPVDVVAGFSGGAILGAYLATGRLDAYLDRCRGLALTALMPTAIVYSRAVETFIDCEFAGANLDELDVRFVPMTVELRTDGSSRKCAVIGGTMGEGVRVSGIALGVFSPAERRGTRYVDGGVAMGVPTEALPRYGADLAIACNSIVAPPTRLLQDMLPPPFGQCLRWMPVTSAICEHLTDRFADYWVGFLTMLREAARSGGRDAQVYYEVSSEETPFIDAFLWYRMKHIRDAAAKGRKWQDELDRSADLWSTLRRSG
jgi:predicted acylesterase/phospholipase RssA